CSICCTFFVRALKPVGTSGALSRPQGKTGHPVLTRLKATSRIGCPISPRALASTSPCSARVSIGSLRAPHVDQLELVRQVPHLLESRTGLGLSVRDNLFALYALQHKRVRVRHYHSLLLRVT